MKNKQEKSKLSLTRETLVNLEKGAEMASPAPRSTDRCPSPIHTLFG